MAAASSPKPVETNPAFGAPPLMRICGWFWNAMTVLAVWPTWHIEDRDAYLVLLGLGYLWALHCWPRRIRFRDEALEQRNYFGIMKRIRYEDIAFVSGVSETGGPYTTTKVVVCGPDDTEIVHTFAHADRFGFIAAIEEHTRKKVQYPLG